VPANDSSATRGLLVLAVMVCLAVGGIWIWRQASTNATMGTLIVNVEAEHIRTPYYWVYLKEAGKPDRIIASRGPSGSDRAWAQPIALSVPPGNYSLELYRSHPGIDTDSTCAVQGVNWFPNPAVTIGKETRIAFGLNAETARELDRSSVNCSSQAYAVLPGDLINMVKSRSRGCEQTVARLMDGLGTSQSSRPVLRESPGFGFSYGAREYDARQVRHMTKALHSGCWGWLRSHLASASAQERAAVSPIVEQSRANIDRLYGLADRLDAGK
jgi:hypothetical protein